MKKYALTCLALLAMVFSNISMAANPQVEIKTNMGSITIELFADKAPKTVENFLRYTKDGFYSGTIFHRVIANFMIQGGGFTPEMKEKATRSSIQNEAPEGSMAGLRNSFGTIAMARTNAPHSATAQFFINVKDNSMLDYPGSDGWGYAVFGKVVKGMEVVMKIRNVPTGRVGGYDDVPSAPVIIESVTVLADKAETKPADKQK